jgi:hypothetical protein
VEARGRGSLRIIAQSLVRIIRCIELQVSENAKTGAVPSSCSWFVRRDHITCGDSFMELGTDVMEELEYLPGRCCRLGLRHRRHRWPKSQDRLVSAPVDLDLLPRAVGRLRQPH